jgi:hypothetical protein
MTIIANVDRAPAAAMIRILVLSENILYADKQTKPYGNSIAITEISANSSK